MGLFLNKFMHPFFVNARTEGKHILVFSGRLRGRLVENYPPDM